MKPLTKIKCPNCNKKELYIHFFGRPDQIKLLKPVGCYNCEESFTEEQIWPETVKFYCFLVYLKGEHGSAFNITFGNSEKNVSRKILKGMIKDTTDENDGEKFIVAGVSYLGHMTKEEFDDD